MNLSANGPGIISYSWSPSTGLSSTTGSLVVAGPLATITYTVTGTDAGGATQSATIIVIVHPVPILSASATNASCGLANGTLNLAVSGGGAPYAYLWSNGSTLEDLFAILAGTYTVTVTNTFGCTAVLSKTVNIGGAFNSSYTQLDNNCFYNANGSINISVSACGANCPYTYLWNTGATTQDLNNLVAGTYTITITNGVNCTNVQTITILSPPIINLQLTPTNVSCFGGATGSVDLTVTGGNPNYAFVWSNSANTEDISNLFPGNYQVTVYDFLGCTSVSNATISQPAPINFSQVTTNASCSGASDGAVDITVTGGNAPYIFSWSNGATTEDVTGLSSGPISVNILDQTGCSYVWNGTITAGAGISLTSVITPVLCFGNSNGSVNISVVGGTSPFNYSWSDGSTNQDLINVVGGNYSVTVTDANGCSTTGNYLILQPSALQLFETHTTAGCNNNSGSINLTVASGSAPYNYLWSNGSTTQDLSGLSGGNYSVTVTDANACTLSLLNIAITPTASNNLVLESIDPSCGINNGIAEIDQLTGGGGPFTYLWNTGGTDNEIDNLPAGTYSLTVTNAAGCTVSASITLVTPNGPTLSSTHVDVLCNGNATGSINLTVTGGTGPFIYAWSNGANIQDISGLVAGTYTVTVTDSNNCQVISSITISQNPSISIAQLITNSNCGLANGIIDINPSGVLPFTYLWNTGAVSQDLNLIGAGSYSVTITDANGCTASFPITVGNNAAPTLSLTTSPVSCNGGSNGTITNTVNGGTSPFSYLWNNGATTQSVANLTSGIYSVTVTDANTCTTVAAVIIIEPAATVLSSTQINATCGLSNGSINLSVNGANPPFTYLWSNGAIVQDINSLPAGNYTVTVTDFNLCTTSLSVSISNSGGPTLSETHTNVLCNGAATGSITLTVNGGTSPYSFLWSNAAITQNINSLSAGSYTVTVTDFNNCQSVLSVSITQPSALALSETHIDANCGTANGSINLSVVGGTAPYTYLWSNSAITQDISTLLAGNYTVTVTDFNSCTSSLAIVILNSSGPVLSETHTNVLCNSASTGSITLTVNGGTTPYSFLWSNAAITQNINALSAGNYTVTVTDFNNCQSTLSINITEPIALTLSETHIDANCGTANGSINLSTAGGTVPYSYLWNNGAITQDISSLISGNYTVTVTDFNLCTASVTVSISNTSGPTLSEAHTNVLCNGASTGSITLTINGGTLPYSFIWSNAAITQNINSLSAGNYTVTVTDFNNCQAVLSINITEPTALALSETHIDANCGTANGSIDLTVVGGTAPYSYLWSNAAITQDIAALPAGNYTVTVTDFNSCTSTLSVSVSNTSGPVLSETHVDVLCNGASTGSITLTVNGGATPYSFIWSNAAITQNINSLSAGNYTVTVTDFNNCQAVLAVSITEPTALALGETHIDANCGTANGSINLSVAGGTAPYSYLWSNGAITQNLVSLLSGNYTVTVTDFNLCSGTISISISGNSGPTLSEIHTDVACNGGATGSINLSVNGGTSPYTFIWSNAAITQNLAALSAGNYTVTVTDFNNCLTTLSVTITQPTILNLSETHVNANCGISNGSINLTVTGATSPYTYLWSNGNTNQDVSNLGSGVYSVTVTDFNNCSSTIQVNLSNGNGPVLSETHINANCGIASGSINLTVAGGNPPYLYVWSNAFTTQDISNLIGGVYTVTVTDNSFCATVLTINLPSTTAVTLQTTITDVTCFGFNDGAINLTANGGTPNYTYHWNTNATTQNLLNIGGSIYNVTVTDQLGCTATISATVVEHAQLTPSQTHVNANCGQSNGSIDLNAVGGYQPYNYSWNNGATTQDLSGLAAGNYSVTVSDVNGCTATLSTSITITAGPSLQFSATSIICNGATTGAVNLTVSGGSAPYNYIWNNGTITQDLNNVIAGNYSVTVTDANNCTVSGSATVTQPAALQITEVHTGVTCGNANGTIDVTVSGGTAPYSYSWNTGVVTEDLINLNIGNYNLTVTDAVNCTSTISISIINAGGTLSLSVAVTDESCNSANGAIDLSVNSGTAPFNYIWNNNAITEDLLNLTAASFTVTVTDAGGCTGSVSATVNNLPAPSASATHIDESCSGANGSIDLTVTGSTSPYTFIWSNNSILEDQANLVAGNYSVTVTDINNCTVGLTVSISNSPAPVITEVHSDENCSQSNGAINLTINSGSAPFNFNWSNGDTNEDLSNLIAGNYTVTVFDANNCSSTISISINNIPGPTLTETHVATSCGLNNASIDLSVNGGTQPFNYLWSNGALTQDLQNIAASAFSVTVTDAGGCTASLAGIIINASTSPALSQTNTTATCGYANGAIDLSVANGISPYTYLWNNNAVTEDLLSILPGTYTVTVTDAANCTALLNVTVNNIAGPQLSISPIATTCGNNDGSIDLSVNGGTAPYSYQWNNLAVTEDVVSLPGGSYTVTVTDGNGCTATIAADVIASIYPVINSTVSGNKGCIPLNVLFNNTSMNAASYTWIFGDGTTSNAISPTHQYTQTGNFVVELIAISATGCADTVTVDTISIYETPVADYTSVPWINESTLLSLAQFQFTNQSVFASTYLWNFGDGNNSTEVNPVYTFTTEGEFYVTLFAFNNNGCADTITYGPFTLIADGDIFIPNTFTPNGDKNNDVFRIYGTGITSEHLWIYDRWGEKLFESTELFSSWDGKYHGVDLNVGVYVYQIEVTRYDGTVIYKKGDVTLLR